MSNENITVSSSMRESSRKAIMALAVGLSLVVYLAGLVYAGVRSYSLFARTIDPQLLPLAVIGILAMELSALGLPLAIHFWTSPGLQRFAAWAFYGVDLVLVAFNAVLDAAHYSGAILPDFMKAYGTFGLPALPIICMVGWAVIWVLDPTSKESDMRASVRAATRETLFSKIQQAAGGVDVTAAVERAASEAARALIGETLGSAPRMSPAAMAQFNAELPALGAGGGGELTDGDDMPTGPYPAVKRNGHKVHADPKA